MTQNDIPNADIDSYRPVIDPETGQEHAPQCVECRERTIGPFQVTEWLHDHLECDVQAFSQLGNLVARHVFHNRGSVRVRACEVGTWVGTGAVAIIHGMLQVSETIYRDTGEKLDIHFDCIDSWQPSPHDHLQDYHRQYGLSVQPVWHDNIAQLLEVKHTVVNVDCVSLDSQQAAKLYRDESLDLVFIDAGHSYAEAAEDFRLWFPKVAPQAFLAGHDYSRMFPGVVVAVDQNARHYNQSAPAVFTNTSVWIVKKR